MNAAAVAPKKREEETETPKLPKIGNSVPRIRDELWAGCDSGIREMFAKALLKFYPESIDEKTADVNAALKDIAKFSGKYAHDAFVALGGEAVSALFVKYSKEFAELARAAGESTSNAFFALGNDSVAALFEKNVNLVTKTFETMKSTAGEEFGNALLSFHFAIESEQVSKMLEQDTEKTAKALGGIANGARWGTRNAYMALSDEAIVTGFGDYCSGKIRRDDFLLQLLTTDSVAIELGRPLDDLHDKEAERLKYLNGLSTLQVLSLLCSNPGYFYTTSNHHLFSKLKKDLGTTTVSELFKGYSLFDCELCRNFLFRAVNYDRLYGKEDSVLSKSDVPEIMSTLLAPLESGRFDKNYFFLLANSAVKLKEIEGSGLLESVEGRLAGLREKGELKGEDKQIETALEYMACQINKGTGLVTGEKKAAIGALDELGYFERENYTVDGKLRVIQVFEKKDTEKTHWGMTKNWFAKLGKPKTGKSGELIYETADTKLILFMGDSSEENARFVRSQLDENPNMIISYRGESFNLDKSFPYNVFGDRGGHILFIPGSCGSSNDKPEYMEANKNTDLRSFANTSTGRGQVTNTIIDALIRTIGRERFEDILKSIAADITANKGDINTIQVWSPGEALLKYVYSNTAAGQ
ncbi:MAG: hypothetical protein V1909_00170 [Candidatus Micrarchaeota archaeon]